MEMEEIVSGCMERTHRRFFIAGVAAFRLRGKIGKDAVVAAWRLLAGKWGSCEDWELCDSPLY